MFEDCKKIFMILIIVIVFLMIMKTKKPMKGGGVNITISLKITGRAGTHLLTIDSDKTLEDLRKEIHQTYNTDRCLEIKFGGETLRGNLKLLEYGIENESILYVTCIEGD